MAHLSHGNANLFQLNSPAANSNRGQQPRITQILKHWCIIPLVALSCTAISIPVKAESSHALNNQSVTPQATLEPSAPSPITSQASQPDNLPPVKSDKSSQRQEQYTTLSERDRLILERFLKRIIPAGN